MDATALEQRLLNDHQRDFPLIPRPYARIAVELGITEDEVLDRLAALHRDGAISRVGAAVRPGTAGASTLAAMRVPENRLKDVAAQVSAHPEVNHNYERDHEINLWFVITAADEVLLGKVLNAIEAETGIEAMDLRLLTPFHIDLGFDLS